MIIELLDPSATYISSIPILNYQFLEFTQQPRELFFLRAAKREAEQNILPSMPKGNSIVIIDSPLSCRYFHFLISRDLKTVVQTCCLFPWFPQWKKFQFKRIEEIYIKHLKEIENIVYDKFLDIDDYQIDCSL